MLGGSGSISELRCVAEIFSAEGMQCGVYVDLAAKLPSKDFCRPLIHNFGAQSLYSLCIVPMAIVLVRPERQPALPAAAGAEWKLLFPGER